MQRSALVLIAALGLWSDARGQFPFLITESALTIGKGKVGVGAGFEYLEKSNPIPGNAHSMFRLFVLSARHGVADNVNYDLSWRGGLLAHLHDGRKEFDWGDLLVWTTIAIYKGGEGVPAIAVRSGVKLPNTRYTPSRLGSNEMDFHSRLLLSKQLAAWELRANIGFSILGDPREAGSQDDVYSLHSAFLFSATENLRFFTELLGQSGYRDHDDKLVARLGFISETSYLTWNVYGSVRLAGNNRDFGTAFEYSENWSVGIFLQKELRVDLWD